MYTATIHISVVRIIMINTRVRYIGYVLIRDETGCDEVPSGGMEGHRGPYEISGLVLRLVLLPPFDRRRRRRRREALNFVTCLAYT